MPSINTISVYLCVLFAAIGVACSSSGSGPNPDSDDRPSGWNGSGGGPAGSGGALSGTGGVGGAAGIPGTGGGATGGSGGATDAGGMEVARDSASPATCTPPPAMPSYRTDIAPIIAAKCSPCHTTDAKAGFNWSYDNLVTNSAVTNMNAGCSPGEPPAPTPGATAACQYLEFGKVRVIPGMNYSFGLLWVKIFGDDHILCNDSCGMAMPPKGSGKSLTTCELDTFKKWMQTGAKP